MTKYSPIASRRRGISPGFKKVVFAPPAKYAEPPPKVVTEEKREDKEGQLAPE